MRIYNKIGHKMSAKEAPMLKLMALVLPVLAVVLISGCVTGPTGGGPGVIVLEWGVDNANVESRDDVQFRLSIQNQGGEEAQNVHAILTGVSFGLDEWMLMQGSEYELLETSMVPPNPRYNTEGQTSEFIWHLEAPMLPEGITQTYTPGVRVMYDYVTTAVKPITLVNEDELRHIMDIGGSLPTQAGTHSNAPISVNVITGTSIKTSNDDPLRRSFPITITITNSGGGIPYMYGQGYLSQGITEDIEYMALMAIQLPSGLGFAGDCGKYSGSGPYQGQPIQLWRGSEKKVTCELLIQNPPAVSTQETIKIWLSYGYAVDKATTVNVKGVSL
jgi:hypothetical protein